MQRVLFLIPNLMHGGAEKVLINLVNNLDRKKYDITLFSIFDCGVNKDYLSPNIKYKYKFKRVFRGNSHFFKLFSSTILYKWFIKEKYDIVVSYLEGVAARIVSGCPVSDTKIIAWIHIELNNKSMVSRSFRSFAEAKKCYERFDKIIGVSQRVVELFKQNVTNKISVEVLYNTNETEEIIQKSKELITEIEFKKDCINICSVAKIVHTKGYDRLLSVHKRLLNEGLIHNIFIVGIGEEQNKLERKAKELGVENSFRFIGFHKNPYKYVSKCDLYVCSSRREGFSTAVTEALVLGVPVVSTNCSGATELLGENNEYGIVVENSTEGIYTGMKELLDYPQKLKHYKKQAEIRSSFFSKENTVNAVEELFDIL